jgi:hypothetical protein
VLEIAGSEVKVLKKGAGAGSAPAPASSASVAP